MFVTQKSRMNVLISLFLVVFSFTIIGNASAAAFPETIALPNGFQPEGIATGRGTTFYVGSMPMGAVYRGDLRTGDGAVLVQGGPGKSALGLKVDRRVRIFVAGGATGKAFVYGASDGSSLMTYSL